MDNNNNSASSKVSKKTLGKDVLRSFTKLKDKRLPYEYIWRDAYRWTYPKRGMNFITKNSSEETNIVSANKYEASIFDSSAREGLRLLASSMLSGLTPSNSLWFKMTVSVDEEDLSSESKEWLSDTSNTIFREIHSGSNYDAQALEFFLDIGIAGQAGLYVDKIVDDATGDVSLYFEEWALDGLYVQSTFHRGEIDTVYRACPMTGQEAVDKFGFDILPTYIQEEFNKDPYSARKFNFVHRITPRIKKNGKQAQGKMRQTMPYQCVYVEEKTQEVVYEGGYEEFPCIIPRWMLLPGTDYATGPIDEALPDVKTLNKLIELLIRGNELNILPPMKALNDGVINPNTVIIGAGKIIPVGDMANLVPLNTQARFDIAAAEILRLQNQIKRVLMSDILQPLEKAQMTATEVTQRIQIVRRILGPVYSRLQAEFLKPLLARCFGILFRAGKLGTPPDELQGLKIQPIYLSPQARAQRMEDVDAMVQYEERLQVQAQGDPSVLDNYDIDVASRLQADLLGVPPETMRDKRKVQERRDARVKATADAQAAALAMNQGQPQPGF